MMLPQASVALACQNTVVGALKSFTRTARPNRRVFRLTKEDDLLVAGRLQSAISAIQDRKRTDFHARATVGTESDFISRSISCLRRV